MKKKVKVKGVGGGGQIHETSPKLSLAVLQTLKFALPINNFTNGP